MISHESKTLIHANRIVAPVGGTSYPVCAEIHPTSHCPHDCVWCFNKEERKGNPSQMNFKDVAELLPQMVQKGLKAVQITGGGEPLAYRDIDRLLALCNGYWLEVGLETSGELMEKAMPFVSHNWLYVRFSLDAYDRESYVRTRAVTSKRDFGAVYDKVVGNLKQLIRVKKLSGAKFKVVLGYVVHALNYDENEMICFFNDCDRMGVDLIQIRPDFTDPASAAFTFEKVMVAKHKYRNLDITVSTKVIRPYGYGRCFGAMLSTTLYYTNKVVVCCMRPDLVIGDLSEPFDKLWSKALNQIASVQTDTCPPCRFHKSNVVLNELVRSDNHVNML